MQDRTSTLLIILISGNWRNSNRKHGENEKTSSLAAPDEDHGEAGCPPAAHGGPWWSRYPPVAHGRDPMLEQVDACRKL